MSRSAIIFFSILLVLVSLFGISSPHNSIEWLMAAGNQLDGLRIGVALVLLTFGALIPVDGRVTRYICRLLGLLMLGVLAGNWFYPDVYAEHNINFLTLDVLSLLEGAVVCFLLSMYQADDQAVLPRLIESAGGTPQPPMARPAS